MEEQIRQLENRISVLESTLKSLTSFSTIPLEIGEAFRNRLKVPSSDTNDTAITSYVQAVNEAGSASYNVAKPMTGFITITINGDAKLVPYY